MSSLRAMGSTAALCATVAVSLVPTSSFAGVMSITDKASVSLSSSTNQVDWRPYRHHHHRWHMGWYYGWPRYRIGTYAAAAPLAAYGSAYPSGCGVHGTAYPAYGGCGAWGYGGGLFGMGLGPF
ncbi:hypothetical protein [Methylocystis iwaonis]|uniref:Sulfur globule protein n=1 Tax=Methylocystis iwaonis TaxID=2885079 RepID=A0ABN6VL71_9HYPH|nr:hypothetical protein [Methylocystis iwaonis]BDV36518.1 hypothetical protein SS37A_40480 [Methylocystis iwaonis]